MSVEPVRNSEEDGKNMDCACVMHQPRRTFTGELADCADVCVVGEIR